MGVFVVLGIFQGIPSEVYCLAGGEAARKQAYELAKEYDVLGKPWDWEAEDGRWNPRQGSQREWEHHWYDDESDVIVAECRVEQGSETGSEAA